MGSGRVNAEIIFCGRSNVGKSTLFSHLFGVRVRKGKKPGTTIEPNFYRYRDFLATDLPGFGYMKGRSDEFVERVKDFIVGYIEENSYRIWAGVVVIDSGAFREIVERWESRGYIPVEIEIVDFLKDLDIEVFICANKMDRVRNRKETLKYISEKTGITPEMIFPCVAKTGEVGSIKDALKNVVMQRGRSDLLTVFK